jgi:hypothetical protein
MKNQFLAKGLVIMGLIGFLCSIGGCALLNMELREYWRQIKLVDLQVLSAGKELEQYFNALKSGKSTGLMTSPRETADKFRKIKKDLLAIKVPAETKNHHKLYISFIDTTIELIKEADAMIKLLPLARSASIAYELKTKHLPKLEGLLTKMQQQGKDLDAERLRLHAASYGLTSTMLGSGGSSGFPK